MFSHRCPDGCIWNDPFQPASRVAPTSTIQKIKCCPIPYVCMVKGGTPCSRGVYKLTWKPSLLRGGKRLAVVTREGPRKRTKERPCKVFPISPRRKEIHSREQSRHGYLEAFHHRSELLLDSISPSHLCCHSILGALGPQLFSTPFKLTIKRSYVKIHIQTTQI